MPSFRFRLILVIISAILSAGLLAWRIPQLPDRSGGKYAALIFDETAPDRKIRESLENAGFTGLVSESGQRVLLDVFDTLEFVPLDEYEIRVFPFDPRNDGYAQRLRSLFVRDGKRYIYLPVSGMYKAAAFVPDSYPYSLEYAKSKMPAVFPLALFGFSVCLFFIIRPLRSALAPYSALIPCLPALAPFALGGAAGFAITALLAGFAVFLAQVFSEKQFPVLFFGKVSNSQGFTHSLPVPFGLVLLLSFLFLTGCGFLSFFSDLALGFSLLAFGLFFGIFFVSLRLASSTNPNTFFSGRPEQDLPRHRNRNFGHHRFAPVQIFGRKKIIFSFHLAMIPFTVMALVPAFLDIETSAASPVNFLPENPVNETDWQNHFYFQSTFSTKSLYETQSDTLMPEFTLSHDGLVIQVLPEGDIPELPVPPFPLEDFFRDLDTDGLQVNASRSSKTGGSTASNFLYILVPLVFIVPALVYRRNAKGRMLSSHLADFQKAGNL